jgi:hypothetical protein
LPKFSRNGYAQQCAKKKKQPSVLFLFPHKITRIVFMTQRYSMVSEGFNFVNFPIYENFLYALLSVGSYGIKMAILIDYRTNEVFDQFKFMTRTRIDCCFYRKIPVIVEIIILMPH